MKSESFTPVSEIGYPALTGKLERYGGSGRDDFSVEQRERISLLQAGGSDRENLLAADSLIVEGVHFDPVYTPLEHLGFKTVTAVTSKLIASNVRPVLLTASLAIPNRYSVEMLEKIFSGMDRACSEYGSALRPSELTPARGALTLSVQALALSNSNDVIGPGTGEESDLICITGDVGAAMAGLRILMREKSAWKERGEEHFEPELDGYEYVVGRQLMPRARFDLLDALKASKLRPRGMLDISQGVLNELHLLLSAAGKGCDLYAPALPIAPETRTVADEMKEDVDRYALYGGEDFELLFLLDKSDEAELKRHFSDFTVVGRVRSQEHGIVLHSGEGESSRLEIPG